MRRVSCIRIAAWCLGAFLPLAWPPATTVAAPVFGKVFSLPQPDGTEVQLQIWGDEFYGVTETLDGYAVVRDPGTQFFCYARLSGDGNELISTGVPVGQPVPADQGVSPHMRVDAKAARAKAQTARLKWKEDGRSPAKTGRVQAAPVTGEVHGLCLIVEFRDVFGSITPQAVSDFCNQAGYTGYGNNGSVRDYFYDVSDGKLTYTNYVPTAYYRAIHTRSYYTDPSIYYGLRAQELIAEALDYLESHGFDFSLYDQNGDGYIDALNCFYAGTIQNNWSEGLWPHSSSMWWTSFCADGVCADAYEITNMGSTLSLGTFCHENGHMVCDWPDLYDYGYESVGVGAFCLMAAGNFDKNPVEPSAYLKYIAGWSTTSVLTTPRTGLSVPSGVDVLYKFPHPFNPAEYYLIENREKTLRDANLPDSGLAIWHIDTAGSNDNEQMTPDLHYLVTLVQADGRWDLEHNQNYGDSTDLWGGTAYPQCTPFTTVKTDWWSGAPSGLAVRNISAPAATMTFDYAYTPDCNDNGVPDSQDITSGTSQDRNGNLVPDECETDCNGNGIPDDVDIRAGTSSDCQGDGIPDDCQWGAWNDPGTSQARNKCSDAQPVAPGIYYTGTTTGMTTDGAASCGESNTTPDVWYFYTAAQAGLVTASLCGSHYDTVLSVHTGCPGTAANQVACNDESQECGSQSKVLFVAYPGIKYLIRVSGWNGDAGSFLLFLTGPAASPLWGDCNSNGLLDACEQSQLLPVVVAQPADFTAIAGGAASFSVSATSNRQPSYQWQKDGVSILGATASTYTIPNVDSSHIGKYRAEIRTACGAVFSNEAALTVMMPLTVSVEGQGSVVVDPPNGPYAKDAIVKLTPQATGNWQFSRWAGGAQGSIAPVYVRMMDGMSVTAVFEQVQHLLTVNIQGDGAVTQTPPGPNYAVGTSVLLKAKAQLGSQFVRWTGDASGTSDSATVTMDGDRTVTAVFEVVTESSTPTQQEQPAAAAAPCGTCGAGAAAATMMLLFCLKFTRRRGYGKKK